MKTNVKSTDNRAKITWSYFLARYDSGVSGFFGKGQLRSTSKAAFQKKWETVVEMQLLIKNEPVKL